MSLSHHRQHQLYRIESGLLRADPQLAAMLGIFGKLPAGQAMPSWEQVPTRRDRIRQAAALTMQAITLAAAAIGLLLSAIWRGLRRGDILPLRPATLVGGLTGRRDHLIPDRALRRLAARHLQFERLEQAAIPLDLVAFDLLAGRFAGPPPGTLGRTAPRRLAGPSWPPLAEAMSRSG
jgi:hypothetical protein